MAMRVRPVTDDTWEDFVALFEARGSPHYCFCTVYRFNQAKQKRAAMKKLVATDTPIGVLAYEQGEPIGWCSVAPRETYRLQRSRTMPRATPDDVPTWTVLCFFVKREHRGEGTSRKLLRGAIAYAKRSGAEVLEGYPFDTAGISSTHRGHSSLYAAAGFTRDGNRWFLRL